MALINCSECNHSVSDKAPACPNCGNPISTAREVSATGSPLQTIQETSKRLKLHVLIGTVLFLFSLISLLWLANISDDTETTGYYAVLAMLGVLVGGIWVLITKVRIWWHHK